MGPKIQTGYVRPVGYSAIVVVNGVTPEAFRRRSVTMTTAGSTGAPERPSHGHPFIEISAGRYRADISAFGGGPRSLEYDGRPLLVDYPRGEYPPLNAGTVLAPWPNRVADGVCSHEGVVHRLEITEPGRSNAIHGFVADRAWNFVEAGADHVTLAIDVDPQPGWQWPMRFTVRWSVDADDGLRADVTAENCGETACPFGFGFHPYLSAADARARLNGPDGHGVELWAYDHFRWFQIFTADPARREGFPRVGRAVAVEPMTCPPDALRSGRDLIRIVAGETIELAMGLRSATTSTS